MSDTRAVEDLREDDRVIYVARVFVVARVEVNGDEVRVGLCSLPADGRGATTVTFDRGKRLPLLPRVASA